MKIHVDSDDCDCGRCEPAAPMVPMTAGALVSGNPACDWPACSIRVEQCMWGDVRCFDANQQR
jgi:hypothetical protein